MMKEDTVLTTASSTPPSDAEVIALDTKALEAALNELPRKGCCTVRIDSRQMLLNEWLELGIRAYLSALPKPSDEVAGMVKRLREWLPDNYFPPTTPRLKHDIAEAATLLSALASRAQTAEAVAAKSREEALEEAARKLEWLSDQCMDDGHAAVRKVALKEAALNIRALKSSRTDSGQPPATVSVESGRATEDDGATKAKATQGTKEAG